MVIRFSFFKGFIPLKSFFHIPFGARIFRVGRKTVIIKFTEEMGTAGKQIDAGCHSALDDFLYRFSISAHDINVFYSAQ
jgi:hypothetical protein